MDCDKRIEYIKSEVKRTMQHAECGHDYSHAIRVMKNAEQIAQSEGGDISIIQAAALLHDVSDEKFSNGNTVIGLKLTENILKKAKFKSAEREKILDIIQNISYKGGFNVKGVPSIECAIVQDADRLDAIGAIGIARAFHYGGYKNRELYNPEIEPKEFENAEEYRQSNGTTINHFYEKLLKLKYLMNTPTAKEMAEPRHTFLEQFLKEFMNEWGTDE
ncbi:MAG: HD domain-containing protein [Bacteroidales bacterium]|nr:HD domain-containing protein [Bacteroidales bacterium]